MSMTNSYIFGKSEKKIGGCLLKIDQLISGYGSVQILNGIKKTTTTTTIKKIDGSIETRTEEKIEKL